MTRRDNAAKRFVTKLWTLFTEHASTIQRVKAVLVAAAKARVSYASVHAELSKQFAENCYGTERTDTPVSSTPEGRSFLTTVSYARRLAEGENPKLAKYLAPIRKRESGTKVTPSIRLKRTRTAARVITASLEAGVKTGLTKKEASTLAMLLAKL